MAATSYQNLDSIQRPSNGAVLLPNWGDAVNDNFNWARNTQLLVASVYGPTLTESIPSNTALAGGRPTAIPMASTIYDPSSCITGSGTYNVKQTGVYMISLQVGWQQTIAAEVQYAFGVLQQGTELAGGYTANQTVNFIFIPNSSGNDGIISGTSVNVCTVGDTLNIYAGCTGTGLEVVYGLMSVFCIA